MAMPAMMLNIIPAIGISFVKMYYAAVVSLNDIIQTRATGRILAPDFILFFGGRQPTCIIQFCLTLKSSPVVSEISKLIC